VSKILASAGGESYEIDFGMDFASVLVGERGVEIDVREQVGFGEDHQGSAVEDAGILQRLVFAFGNAEENDFGGFA